MIKPQRAKKEAGARRYTGLLNQAARPLRSETHSLNRYIGPFHPGT